MFSLAAATLSHDLYLQEHAPTDQLASPLFGELSQFPPAFISVGQGEILLDDSVLMQTRLTAAGRKAELCVVDGMGHVAVTRSLDLPGAQQVFAATVKFLDQFP